MAGLKVQLFAAWIDAVVNDGILRTGTTSVTWPVELTRASRMTAPCATLFKGYSAHEAAITFGGKNPVASGGSTFNSFPITGTAAPPSRKSLGLKTMLTTMVESTPLPFSIAGLKIQVSMDITTG